MAVMICASVDFVEVLRALSITEPVTGSRMPASTAMMEITTSSSSKVKAAGRRKGAVPARGKVFIGESKRKAAVPSFISSGRA